ncbi:MAG: PQQ-binding-like beta-propeller repeat protein [Acidobacteriota bacterium]
MRSRGHAAGIVVGGCLAAWGMALAGTAEWPHQRGPAFDGRISGTELFTGGEVGLAVAWRIPLGPGYSGIAVAHGRAVTLYSDGSRDWAIAVDTRTGKAVWRFPIGATYRGHDGSNDGPLSTPIIQDGVVYGLGPRGNLFALKLSDGREIWSRMLPLEFGSREPEYGFGTSPLVQDNLLVIQTGGPDGHAVSGLKTETGEMVWGLGDAEVDYQSPAVLTLVGQPQVVAVSGHQIAGIAPASGTILWQHAVDGEDWMGSSSPTPLGKDRFLLFVGGEATVFKVARSAAGYQVSEMYRSPELGKTYALPVYHQGYLYGFKGQILACVDARSGARVWRSRPPGGRGLILVDGHLVIFAARGQVVLAKASPEGYLEEARVQALGASAHTWPSFADGKVFVRNVEEMAAVSLVPRPAPAIAGTPSGAASPVPSDTPFARFVRRVGAAGRKQELVDAFLEEHHRFPIIEGETVHFIYAGKGEDVTLSGNMIDSGQRDPLQRIEGTDLHHRSYRMVPGGRWEYRFHVDFDDPILDPRNPETVPSREDDVGWSQVGFPGWKAPAHIANPAGRPRGAIETFQFKSAAPASEREVRVYLPPGYEQGESRYPLLIVHGLDWLDKGLLANTLDHLSGKDMAPIVVAFVAPRTAWWREAGGSGLEPYVKMLAEDLVATLEKRYRLQAGPGARAVMGTGGFGLTAAYAALRYPEVFGKAVIQSVFLGMGGEDALLHLIRAGRGKDIQFYLDWNRYERHSAESGRDLRQDSLKLAEALKAGGYCWAGGEALDAYGWGSWRARTDRILEVLFPPR